MPTDTLEGFSELGERTRRARRQLGRMAPGTEVEVTPGGGVITRSPKTVDALRTGRALDRARRANERSSPRTTTTRPTPARRSGAGQFLSNPTGLTAYTPGAGPQITAVGKVAAVFLLLMLGLDVYARATGATFTLDLLNPTQLFGGSDQAPQLPAAASFQPHPSPPSATSPGGGGGHSNQS